MLKFSYNESKFLDEYQFKMVDLSLIKDFKRIQTLYCCAKKELGVNASLYHLESYIFNRLARAAIRKHLKEKKIDDPATIEAFLESDASKLIIKNAMKQMRIKNRVHLFNIVQTLMLQDLGINVNAKKPEEVMFKKVRKSKDLKPSAALKKMIAEARDRLEEAGENRNDPYLVVRELNEIAFKKYTGDNYFNQLKRMGIESTYDYLNYVEYVLERG